MLRHLCTAKVIELSLTLHARAFILCTCRIPAYTERTWTTGHTYMLYVIGLMVATYVAAT